MAGLTFQIQGALDRAGLLPAPCDDVPHGFLPARVGQDLLPALVDVWCKAACPETVAVGRRRAVRMVEWLKRQQASGARLTLGIPGMATDVTRRWLGYRLAWWPDGIPDGRRVGLASSRLGRILDGQRPWFTILRAACAKVDPGHDLLVAAVSTTAARFVKRSARLFELPVLTIDAPHDDGLSLASWFRRIRTGRLGGDSDSSARAHRVSLSPPVLAAGTEGACDPFLAAVPIRDRALVAVSDRLLVFRVRAGGHVLDLLRARLRDQAWAAASVYVAMGPGLVPQCIAEQLLDLGAVGWLVPDVLTDPDAAGNRSAVAAISRFPAGPGRRRQTLSLARQRTGPAPIIVPPGPRDWQFLSHCTRRQAGPWPGQAEEDHLDDLILSREEGERTPLATLHRIVRERRLMATCLAIRGATRVVSFTEVPLSELECLRVFRPHRGRWDFQPYGICIHRLWLEQTGARRVRYGDETLWATLAAAEQPFFQLCGTRPRGGARTIDWTSEREWRHLGDVDLSRLPFDAGLLFVPTVAEARELAAISPWPVTVLQR